MCRGGEEEGSSGWTGVCWPLALVGVHLEGWVVVWIGCEARANSSAWSWEGILSFGQDERLLHRSHAIFALSASFLAVMAMPSPNPRP